MNEDRLATLPQLRQFVEGTTEVEFRRCGKDEDRYRHIEGVLRRFRYARLKRADKGLVVRYLMRTTGYSRPQLVRLIKRARVGALKKGYRAPTHGFARRFTDADVALLAATDTLHGTLSGPATRHLMQRALATYGDARYARLATISNGHLYNLRKRTGYIERRREWTKTHATQVSIGERRAPAPDGRPGFIRIDSVHQGDWDGIKGVYHINAVDCITQWEVTATVQTISEAHLLPVIEQMLAQFPFAILGFHADNGSEYVNHRVAKMLEKLRIEFTRSRPRRSNDNGLAETKNGAVVRKIFGYEHIHQRHAVRFNIFCVGIPQPVPELPPSVPVRHRTGRPQEARAHQARVPGQRRDDAAGQAHQPARCGAVPAHRHHALGPARPGGGAHRCAGGRRTQ